MKEIMDFIEKAERFLRTAKQALNTQDYDSSVSRCYYAMFFMTEAVLLTKGLTASSHKGRNKFVWGTFYKNRNF